MVWIIEHDQCVCGMWGGAMGVRVFWCFVTGRLSRALKNVERIVAADNERIDRENDAD